MTRAIAISEFVSVVELSFWIEVLISPHRTKHATPSKSGGLVLTSFSREFSAEVQARSHRLKFSTKQRSTRHSTQWMTLSRHAHWILRYVPTAMFWVSTQDLKICILLFRQLAHMAWSSAAALFEHLARMGLTTASAIERAYKKDTAFLWRLVACFARVESLGCNLVGKLSQVVSWSEHFRPYFKRWRVCSSGHLILSVVSDVDVTDRPRACQSRNEYGIHQQK